MAEFTHDAELEGGFGIGPSISYRKGWAKFQERDIRTAWFSPHDMCILDYIVVVSSN